MNAQRLYETPLNVMLMQLGVKKGDISNLHRYAK